MIKETLKRHSVWFVLIFAFLHLGAIRRDEDPILKSQTDPIALKQKLEETKDGVKGAPTPSFKYYEKEDFLTRTPMKSALENAEPNLKPLNDLDMVTEVEPEIENTEAISQQEAEVSEPVAREEVPKEEEDWWMEDEA